jgi:hypothetical protein
VLRAYLDESRSGDQRIFAVAGWLCTEKDWTSVENEWRQRVEHEQRISIKKHFPPPSRFHASHLSNLRNEFDKSKGWDQDRQKRFSKKLIGILAKKRREPVLGVSMTAIMDNWKLAYKKLEWAEKNVYHHLFRQCVYVIMDAMANQWPDDKVSIFHDFGPFNESAQAAFRALLSDQSLRNREAIVTVAPRRWEDCIALQPADLLAYESQKAAHLGLAISDDAELQRRYRKSLRKLLGGNCTLRGLCFTTFFDSILEIRKSSKNYPIKTAARPVTAP